MKGSNSDKQGKNFEEAVRHSTESEEQAGGFFQLQISNVK